MSLDHLWRFVEARPAGTAVMAEWRERCGDQLPAVEPLLQPTAALARSHPAPKAGRPPLRVVRHKDGTIVGVCDEGRSERLTLARADVVLHGIDPARLRRCLCAALCVKVAHEPAGALPGLLRLGHWEPRPALAVPVVAILVRDEDAMLRELQRAVSMAKKSPIVLTPGRSLWSEAVVAAADSAKATLVPLDEVVAADGLAWRATTAWDGFRRGHLERAGLATPAQVRAAKPKKKRDSRAAAIDALKRDLRQHLLSARNHARATEERGAAKLLPRPTQQELAKRLGISEPTVSRCLNRDADAELKLLWKSANDLEQVLRYRG